MTFLDLSFWLSDTKQGSLMLCLRPIRIKSREGPERAVNCGYCLNCAIKRQTGWVLRLVLESECHEHCSFLTLTYSEDTRPGTLEYEHIQRFLKLLRRSSRTPIRFFCCGELGSVSEREHWHLILYGFPPPALGLCHIEQWKYGHVFSGTVTKDSAAYVARYSLKGGKIARVISMSRRPGIGLERIKEIGTWCASQISVMDYCPAWWRWGKTVYPLDRSARENFSVGFLNGGGSFRKSPRTALSMDVEARLLALCGDPFATDQHEAFSVAHLQKEELERGTF